jgi:anthranilate synthase component 2
MILLIDNYDSFSYNLYQLVGALEPEIRVVRNDALTVQQIEEMAPQAILLSPGPGRPEEAGVCVAAARKAGKHIPLLGVCLGHQAICTAYGATVSYAKELMHGKQSETEFAEDCPLFEGLPSHAPVARYHSLAVVESTLPACLRVTARTQDGEIMAVQHTAYPIFGVQFHPESIMTPDGKAMLQNFLKFSAQYAQQHK